MSKITREEYQIRAQEIDRHKRATVSAIISCMQEAAWNNAASLDASVYQLQEMGISWVLTRMKLEILRYPKHRDQIQVLTWPSGHERTFVYRDYRILDPEGSVMAQASSTWLVLDLNSRRMTRVPEEFHAIINQPAAIESLPRAKGNWRFPKEHLPPVRFPVRWHDLDLNGHVSNFVYFQWPLEALPGSFLEGHELAEIDLMIRAEGQQEDEIITIAAQTGELEFLHTIQRAEDGKELAKAKTKWRSD